MLVFNTYFFIRITWRWRQVGKAWLCVCAFSPLSTSVLSVFTVFPLSLLPPLLSWFTGLCSAAGDPRLWAALGHGWGVYGGRVSGRVESWETEKGFRVNMDLHKVYCIQTPKPLHTVRYNTQHRQPNQMTRWSWSNEWIYQIIWWSVHILIPLELLSCQ